MVYYEPEKVISITRRSSKRFLFVVSCLYSHFMFVSEDKRLSLPYFMRHYALAGDWY